MTVGQSGTWRPRRRGLSMSMSMSMCSLITVLLSR